MSGRDEWDRTSSAVAIGFAYKQEPWRQTTDGSTLVRFGRHPALVHNSPGVWRHRCGRVARAADDGVNEVRKSRGTRLFGVDVDAVGFELVAGIEVVLGASGGASARRHGGRR